MIFIDSNIPMYLVGSDHPHKTDARRWLEELVSRHERLVTDAEVLQEILHRYVSIARPNAIQAAFDALTGVVDEVFPVDRAAVERAKGVVLGRSGISVRDAIHIAIMQIHGVKKILSFDRGFDAVPGITRLS
ncbi:type II toxin-antitoxin system VapC family toxin [Acidobacteria bacterium AB60]|nr:type II toxin-antitoxin system VapC family toxin [Acidobacteria bacterium AB60]